MPTGCRSVYLRWSVLIPSSLQIAAALPPVLSCHEPAGDLERRAEDLGTYEFRHGEGCVGALDVSVWEMVFSRVGRFLGKPQVKMFGGVARSKFV